MKQNGALQEVTICNGLIDDNCADKLVAAEEEANLSPLPERV